MKLIASIVCLMLTVVQLSSCQRNAPFDPALIGSFFPLRPGLTWVYRVIYKSQENPQIFTDRATGGQERVSAPNAATGMVSEYSGSDGTRDLTILYMVKNGYVSRSVRSRDSRQIMSEEREFLPLLLKPDLTWSNSLFPVGRFVKGFHITQAHRTSLEAGVVLVPAGHYSNCIRIDTVAVYQDDSSKIGARQLRYVDWYAPNVGLIKTVVLESGFFGTEIGRVELLRFRDSRS
jgi:hypothetical protein